MSRIAAALSSLQGGAAGGERLTDFDVQATGSDVKFPAPQRNPSRDIAVRGDGLTLKSDLVFGQRLLEQELYVRFWFARTLVNPLVSQGLAVSFNPVQAVEYGTSSSPIDGLDASIADRFPLKKMRGYAFRNDVPHEAAAGAGIMYQLSHVDGIIPRLPPAVRCRDQYVPPAHIDAVLHNPKACSFSRVSREMTLLVAEIRDFTTVSGALSTTELELLLNELFTALTSIIFEHHGTVDSLIANTIMVLRGSPLEDLEHRSNAELAALWILDVVERLRQEFPPQGFPLSTWASPLAQPLCSQGHGVALSSRLTAAVRECRGLCIIACESGAVSCCARQFSRAGMGRGPAAFGGVTCRRNACASLRNLSGKNCRSAHAEPVIRLEWSFPAPEQMSLAPDINLHFLARIARGFQASRRPRKLIDRAFQVSKMRVTQENGCLAQLVERRPYKANVGGSNPSTPTRLSRGLQ